MFEILRRRKRHFCVHREDQQTSPLFLRAGLHPGHVADDGAGRIDQMRGGKAILGCGADGGGIARSHDRRVDHESFRTGRQDPFDAAPPLTFFDEGDQSGGLE